MPPSAARTPRPSWQPPVSLHPLRREEWDRRAAAEAWLYRAATSQETAGREWATQGVALLAAGIVWDAVRVPHAALSADLERDTDPDMLRRRLHELQLAGPVFCDPYRPYLYVLVPPGTDRQWPRTSPQQASNAWEEPSRTATT